MSHPPVEGVCKSCANGAGLLQAEQIAAALKELEGWSLDDENKCLVRNVEFKNFYRTMAFVNAIAWIAHTQNHHPDMEVGYDTCKVTFTTHDAGGLTQNDFICAAAVNRLLAEA